MPTKVQYFFSCLTAYISDPAVAAAVDLIFKNPSAPAIIDTASVDDINGPAELAYQYAMWAKGKGPKHPWIAALTRP